MGIEQTRVSINLENILSNVYYIFSNIFSIIIDTCSLFPRWLFLILVAIVLCIAICSVFISNKKTTLRNILELTLLAFISIMSSYLTFVLGLSSYFTGRLRFSIGATIGMLFIYLYCKMDIFEKKNVVNYLASSILVFYCVAIVFNYIYLMQQHKLVNVLEKKDAEEIVSYIENYEKENNIEVKYISTVLVLNSPDKCFYKDVKNKSIITYSAVRSPECSGVIKFYTNRSLENVKITTKMRYTYMSMLANGEIPNNYICINDTLYITV